MRRNSYLEKNSDQGLVRRPTKFLIKSLTRFRSISKHHRRVKSAHRTTEAHWIFHFYIFNFHCLALVAIVSSEREMTRSIDFYFSWNLVDKSLQETFFDQEQLSFSSNGGPAIQRYTIQHMKKIFLAGELAHVCVDRPVSPTWTAKLIKNCSPFQSIQQIHSHCSVVFKTR